MSKFGDMIKGKKAEQSSPVPSSESEQVVSQEELESEDDFDKNKKKGKSWREVKSRF